MSFKIVNYDIFKRIMSPNIKNPDELPRLYAQIQDWPLWCDAYHMDMSQTRFFEGRAEIDSTSEAFIRVNPFGGSYNVMAGLGTFLEWLNGWNFSDDLIAWLGDIKFENGQQRYKPEFLDFIKNQPLKITVDAMPEGELFFTNEPVVRVSGPSWQRSIVESALLNSLNAQSLIATRASRVLYAAGMSTVLEMGLRRALSEYGLWSTRAAAVGGIILTSNVAAARELGLPIAGTMAHEFVQEYDTELQAFEAWLRHNPANTTLLTDTFDNKTGVKNAIAASKNTGVKLNQIRIDSGDLAYESINARAEFRNAGMDSKICLSNDLDETIIESLKHQGAPANTFGLGTKLANPGESLGMVYKLKEFGGVAKIKKSNDPIKTTIPGATEIIRILNADGKYDGDVIAPLGAITENAGALTAPLCSINADTQRAKIFPAGTQFYKPLINVVRDGRVDMAVANRPVIEIGRETLRNLSKLDSSHKRLQNPHRYVAGLEKSLFMRRLEMTLGDWQH
ncbi:MAG: nicotinate phosphoribosyltransferase [Proteobacteria bacterium]|nr:nicotinate phosphoribosyltransferase [Pseudomonadota bacterium]